MRDKSTATGGAAMRRGFAVLEVLISGLAGSVTTWPYSLMSIFEIGSNLR